ncbi:MAG: hypothetical protein BroJett020_11720 [Bacteroidota bacterium]|nr:T9SS type A sorting domain-containing protein [Flavobacteriales bacterium]WKZ74934.1 MAG: T9SS type A sorting domain-containing protein [Vicingaceae bacterium]GIK69877.1 MAG: hypothetical protein BroJett020_11720 [Bacteroidota bacterium]
MRFIVVIYLTWCCVAGGHLVAQSFLLSVGDTNTQDIPQRIIEYENCYYVNYCSYDTVTNYYYSHILKIDATGIIISTLFLDSLRSISMYEYNDGIYMLFGKLVKNLPTPEFSTVFMKFNENLQLLAYKELYRPDFVYTPYDLGFYNTDTLMYAGWYFNAVNFSVDYDHFMLMDKSFNILHIDSLAHQQYYWSSSYPHFLNLQKDSIFVIGMNIGQYGQTNVALPIRKSDFTLQPFDTVDYQSNLPEYNNNPLGPNAWLADIRNNSSAYTDSTFLMAAAILLCPTYNTCFTNLGFIEVNKKFIAKNMHHYYALHPTISKFPATFKSLDVNDKNEIYMAGTTHCEQLGCINIPNTKVVVIKTDIEGNVYWQKVITMPDTFLYAATTLKATSDGGVLVAASVCRHINDLNYNIVLIKLDSTGAMVFTNTLPHKNEKPICYPNPTSTSLYLKNIAGPLSYNIVNNRGQVVCIGLYTGEPISVQTLPSGLYVLHLYENNNTHAVRFVKE